MKNTLRLLVVSFLLLIILELVGMLIFSTLIKEHLTQYTAAFVKTHSNVTSESLKSVYEQFSAPLVAKLLDIAAQGIVLFGVAVLIDKRRKYQKKYWASALLLTQLVHNFANSNLGFTPSLVTYLLAVFAALIVGLCAIYLSGKVFAKPALSSS